MIDNAMLMLRNCAFKLLNLICHQVILISRNIRLLRDRDFPIH